MEALQAAETCSSYCKQEGSLLKKVELTEWKIILMCCLCLNYPLRSLKSHFEEQSTVVVLLTLKIL